jgi:D-beta-D-heptose 7-phosphate kinase/D-beta-D-heptose 1-phosphate adenosyltransferase
VQFAILASGVVVGKAGTAVVTPAELIEAELSQHAVAAQAKVTPLDELATEVEAWRRQGLKVGFTNGCFDILHQGHVVYLAKAAEMGNKMIVALNSDQSVRNQNKSPERPINPEDSRAIVLAGLGFIDLVVIFDAETPKEIIEFLNPDVLVKGADYDANETDPSSKKYIVGSDFVRKNNGTVQVVELEQGFSTTSIIEKMKK